MKKTNTPILILICFAVVALASLFASSFPDGLEKVAEVIGFGDKAASSPAFSPFPDYSILPIKSAFWSTFLAGTIGVVAVYLVFHFVGKINRKA